MVENAQRVGEVVISEAVETEELVVWGEEQFIQVEGLPIMMIEFSVMLFSADQRLRHRTQ